MFHIHFFNFICRHQVGAVNTQEPFPKLCFQFIEVTQEIYPPVNGIEQNVVGGGSSFKKENIVQWNILYHIPRP